MERFCTQTIKVPFSNRVFFNSETTVKLPKAGDAISRIRLVIEFPNGSNTYGEQIIREADLLSGQNTIEKLYGEFLYLENQFITRIEKRAFLSNLLCQNSPGTMYLDLPFYSVKRRFFALDTETYLRLIFTKGDGGSELQGHLLVDYMVTREEDVPKVPYFQRIRKLSRISVLTTQPATKQFTIDAYFPGQVYEIFFTVQNTATNEYIDVIENISMFIGETERFKMSGYHLRYLEPLKVYKQIANDVPVYMYSFRLNPDHDIPSGQTNLTDKQRFVLDFYDNEDASYKVTIWTQAHDFFYKKNASTHVKPVFTSDEILLTTSTNKKTVDFQNLNLKVSYTFYVGTAAVIYASNVEIQSVTILATNATTYTITQNEILFTGLDSLKGDYYANVLFSAKGFRDVTCYLKFKSPMSMNEYINGSTIGFYDPFFSGSPKTVIDGDQRFNVYSGTTLNGTPSVLTSAIKNVYVDQYRNYLVSNATSTVKFDTTLSQKKYTVNTTDYVGKPWSYFGTDIVPVSNLFYTYVNNSLSNTNTIQYCNIHASFTDGTNVYVSGTTLDSTSNIVFDLSSNVTSGKGSIRSFLAKYTPYYSYSVVVDKSNGPTDLTVNSNGPVFLFPVSAMSNLFATDATYEDYTASGVSVVQLNENGRRLWANTVSMSSIFPDVCYTDIFNNVYMSYYKTTNYYIRKLSSEGQTKWTRTFTYDASAFSMNVFFSQDVTFVAYTNLTGSMKLIQVDTGLKKNVPSNLTGISSFDSDGNLISEYVTPTSNISDFSNTTRSLYYTPLYDGSYFSSASTYGYTDATKRYWGLFVIGLTTAGARAADSLADDTVFTGLFGYSSYVYPSTTVLPNVQRAGAFIVKADSSCNVKWASYIDNTVSLSTAYSVNITASGNVYASGTYGPYDSSVYNSNGTLFGGSLPQLSDTGVYLVKYDTNGFAIWQTYIDGLGTNETNYNITRKYANSYIIGSSSITTPSVKIYNATLTGGRVPVESGLVSTNNTFIVKYDANGTAQWITSMTGDWQASDICTDSNENILFSCNNFSSGSGQLKQSNGTLFSPSFDARSVVKMTQLGFGILGIKITCERITSIATDPSDNFIVSGRFISTSSVVFYNWNGSGFSLASSLSPSGITGDNAFIVKYNSSGVFQWRSYIIHNTGSGGQAETWSTACDSAGNVYVIGKYSNQLTTGKIYSSNDVPFSKELPGTASALFGGSYVGGFLVKFNSSGICQWVVILDSNNSEPYPTLTVDSNDNVIITGLYVGKNAKFYDSNDGEHDSQQPLTASQTITYCVKYDTNGFLIPV